MKKYAIFLSVCSFVLLSNETTYGSALAKRFIPKATKLSFKPKLNMEARRHKSSDNFFAVATGLPIAWIIFCGCAFVDEEIKKRQNTPKDPEDAVKKYRKEVMMDRERNADRYASMTEQEFQYELQQDQERENAVRKLAMLERSRMEEFRKRFKEKNSDSK